MGAEAWHNYAASFVAQHLHPLQFKSRTTAAPTNRKAGPTAKPSTPAPTAPARPAPAQQKPMTQADRDDWAQAMGNRLKRKHEVADQAHHDYLMNRSGDVLNRVQRERRAQYGSGPASDLLHTFNRKMDDIQGQTRPTGSGTAHDDVEAAFGPRRSTSTPTPSPSTTPVSHEDTHGQQFTGSTPSTPAPKRASNGYRAKAAHEGAWDGTFPHQEPVDLSSFDHAPVQNSPAPATPTTGHFDSAARSVKFNGTMKEVGREGQDPGANRIQSRFTRHDAYGQEPRPLTPPQRAAQHGLFPVNQIKKVGRAKAPTPEPEHDPRTPGPGQTELFSHPQVTSPKQFGSRQPKAKRSTTPAPTSEDSRPAAPASSGNVRETTITIGGKSRTVRTEHSGSTAQLESNHMANVRSALVEMKTAHNAQPLASARASLDAAHALGNKGKANAATRRIRDLSGESARPVSHQDHNALKKPHPKVSYYKEVPEHLKQYQVHDEGESSDVKNPKQFG